MTRLTFSCSRSTPRSLHIFRKWEDEDWSRRMYTLTCRWLQASKKSVKISVSVKESITRAIICNEFQRKPLGCFHSISREIAHEKLHFQIKYSPLPFFQVVMEHGTVFCDTTDSSSRWDGIRPLVLPYARQIWSLSRQDGFFSWEQMSFSQKHCQKKKVSLLPMLQFSSFSTFQIWTRTAKKPKPTTKVWLPFTSHLSV